MLNFYIQNIWWIPSAILTYFVCIKNNKQFHIHLKLWIILFLEKTLKPAKLFSSKKCSRWIKYNANNTGDKFSPWRTPLVHIKSLKHYYYIQYLIWYFHINRQLHYTFSHSYVEYAILTRTITRNAQNSPGFFLF